MMKYQVAQRNLSYLLHFKPVVNESITMNVLVITQSYYKPSEPQLSSFTLGVLHISLQTLCKWHRNKLVTKASPGSHSAQRLSPGGWSLRTPSVHAIQISTRRWVMLTRWWWRPWWLCWMYTVYNVHHVIVHDIHFSKYWYIYIYR